MKVNASLFEGIDVKCYLLLTPTYTRLLGLILSASRLFWPSCLIEYSQGGLIGMLIAMRAVAQR